MGAGASRQGLVSQEAPGWFPWERSRMKHKTGGWGKGGRLSLDLRQPGGSWESLEESPPSLEDEEQWRLSHDPPVPRRHL